MPTNKKRIGFIPREEVMKIIDKLSIENNLSNSKIISILVEEALSVRGIFNKKNYKEKQSYQLFNKSSQYVLGETFESKDNDEFTDNTKLENYKSNRKTPLFEQTKQDDFDLDTYKKFLSFLKFQKMMNEYKT